MWVMDGTEIVAQQPEGCKGPFRTGGRFFNLEGPPPVLGAPFWPFFVCDNVHSLLSIQLPRVCLHENKKSK